jgi:hypothetical protein
MARELPAISVSGWFYRLRKNQELGNSQKNKPQGLKAYRFILVYAGAKAPAYHPGLPPRRVFRSLFSRIGWEGLLSTDRCSLPQCWQ